MNEKEKLEKAYLLSSRPEEHKELTNILKEDGIEVKKERNISSFVQKLKRWKEGNTDEEEPDVVLYDPEISQGFDYEVHNLIGEVSFYFDLEKEWDSEREQMVSYDPFKIRKRLEYRFKFPRLHFETKSKKNNLD